MNEYEKWYKTLIFKRDEILVPEINKIINKIQFLEKTGYNITKQEEYLKKLYNENIDKFSKQ